MRAWYLNDPHQACTPAILEELGACVGKAFEPDKGSDTLFLTAISEKELGAAFADTLKVRKEVKDKGCGVEIESLLSRQNGSYILAAM